MTGEHGTHALHTAAPPDDRQWSEVLVCPDCGSQLVTGPGLLACKHCHGEWPVCNGIPLFDGSAPVWGGIPLSCFVEINRMATAAGWKTALTESREPLVRNAAEAIMNTARANWHLLLGLPRNSNVLEVGAGTGANSHAMGLHYDNVFAAEASGEHADFMRRRFAQERLSNVRVLRTSVWKLPFPPDSFDLVVLDGVLESVAEGCEGNAREIQQRALNSVRRVLRPGGILYLGVKNRVYPEYFVGQPDPHCRLPFVTILPRPLANVYARANGRSAGYRNYLYSSFGYRRLLRKAGFSGIDIYLAAPSCDQPRVLIPLQDNLFAYYSANFNPVGGGRVRRVLHDLLLRFGVLKYMQHSFAIMARKQRAQ